MTKTSATCSTWIALRSSLNLLNLLALNFNLDFSYCMLVHVTLLRLVNYFINMGFSIPHLGGWPKLCVLSLKCVYLKALSHYNVLANVC